MPRPVALCVVGVGAVGRELLKVLRQRKFPIKQLTVLARSARTLTLDGETIPVQAVSEEAFAGQAIVLFAGTEGEKGAAVTYAPAAIRAGAICIDNGADFRMDPKVPLVVPEINPEAIGRHQGLIANPNCSTIQMVMALHPLRQKGKIRRVTVATYQAASGAGAQAVEELKTQTQALLEGKTPPPPRVMPQPLGFNVVPQIGSFGEQGYTTEEWKLVRETRKILSDDTLQIVPTVVRVPVLNGHSEAVTVEMDRPITPAQAAALWKKMPGLEVAEGNDRYPMPTGADGRDPVYIGRVRQAPDDPKTLTFWVVADNLRKGAALNAVQIAEALLKS
ncbi:MAG: aspartate-semialdehyde dehydrogenase [Candidatus Omnitrophica bacterium CG11_big_fil_rev_8_21_14_0_20_64_10]|nr:MAG: aspartate-semialdehyde dehydrogenase [Candidatus Omnitrophica bacterium CG11_big_fil_rev_8_21_14_0_20_64_10]